MELEFSPGGDQASFTRLLPFIVTLSCESIDRPNLRINTERVWNGADYINVPLRGEYDPITVSLYEITKDIPSQRGNRPVDFRAISNLTAESILSYWTNTTFDFKQSRNNYPDARRATVSIYQLNGLGEIIWGYKLYRCWPETVSPETLDYRDSDIAKTRLTLHFDKVEENRTGQSASSNNQE